MYRWPLVWLSASASQIAEYPFEVPISITVLYFLIFIKEFRKAPVSGAIFQNSSRVHSSSFKMDLILAFMD